MSIRQRARRAAAVMGAEEGLAGVVDEVVDGTTQGFRIDPGDFLSAREQGSSAGTRVEQTSASLAEAGEILNQSFPEYSDSGQYTNVISPVVIPKRSASRVLLPVTLLVVVGVVGLALTWVTGGALALFGPHYWLALVVLGGFLWWRRSVVMVPEGCKALITKFGRLEQVAGPGRTTLLNPWKQVSYLVNTSKEYPYNAPIREAPTASGVQASVDLFLQFRIEDPAEFIFVLGGVKGFSDKLENAISEVTRSLIYQQNAATIYDLVGESTQDLLRALNEQFLPAVRLTNANITHAEPSSQEYRMDLAAPEMLRVAKEAYTYEYELQLRKEQNDGDLNKELASLHESLSAIRAEIAGYQAQMDTALERETNRARALARQRFVEAESMANANAALLEAQALDIRAVSAAAAPEILEYQFQRDVLDRLEAVADRLPHVVQLGDGTGDAAGGGAVDFLAIARRLIGSGDAALFSDADMAAIRDRMGEIQARIRGREAEIQAVLAAGPERAAGTPPDGGPGGAPEGAATAGAADPGAAPGEDPGEDPVDSIRRSVRDEDVAVRMERLGERLGEAAPARPQRGEL